MPLLDTADGALSGDVGETDSLCFIKTEVTIAMTESSIRNKTKIIIIAVFLLFLKFTIKRCYNIVQSGLQVKEPLTVPQTLHLTV